MAAAIRPAVPAGPRHPVWVRMQPGATGWGSQSRRTGTPRTPATAHSTWGRNAGGQECTNSTPRAVTGDLRRCRGSASPPASSSSDGRDSRSPSHCAPSVTSVPAFHPVGPPLKRGRLPGMSERIRIQAMAEHEYAVDVTEGTTQTRHRVIVPAELLDDLGLSGADEQN